MTEQLVTLPKQNVNNVQNHSVKALYIIIVDDPSVSKKFRYFAASKIDRTVAGLEIIGLEIDNAHSKKLKTWIDTVQHAKENNLELISIIYPWSRIINIQNVSYKSKVQ